MKDSVNHIRQKTGANNCKNSDHNSFGKYSRRLRVVGAAALALGSIALATQSAQALSPLGFVNGITSSGGVGVSKDILYGDKPL